MTGADHPNNCPLAREVIELGHYENGFGKKFITGTDGWRELSPAGFAAKHPSPMSTPQHAPRPIIAYRPKTTL